MEGFPGNAWILFMRYLHDPPPLLSLLQILNVMREPPKEQAVYTFSNLCIGTCPALPP